MSTIIEGTEHLESIDFSYQDNIIIFELTALNMHDAEENQYAYQSRRALASLGYLEPAAD